MVLILVCLYMHIFFWSSISFTINKSDDYGNCACIALIIVILVVDGTHTSGGNGAVDEDIDDIEDVEFVVNVGVDITNVVVDYIVGLTNIASMLPTPVIFLILFYFFF